MRYRKFGRTGLEVSEVVFGGGWVGGILVHQDDATKRTTLARAMGAGINWIDTAPSYGQGKSEQALGWLLKEIDATPYLSTKVSLDVERLDDIAGQIEASLHASLTRLDRDSVDLLQLHNPIRPQRGGSPMSAVTVEDVLRSGGIADGLERLRAQGLTRHIGFTALGDAAACREVIASGRMASAQIYYNLLNPSAAQAMPAAWSGHDFSGILAACETHGVATLGIRVFAAGAIATDERHGREVVLADDSEVADEERRARVVFAELGDEYGTRAETAIRFALAEQRLAGVIFGLAELSHLEEVLAAQAAGPLPTAALERLGAVYASDFGRA